MRHSARPQKQTRLADKTDLNGIKRKRPWSTVWLVCILALAASTLYVVRVNTRTQPDSERLTLSSQVPLEAPPKLPPSDLLQVRQEIASIGAGQAAAGYDMAELLAKAQQALQAGDALRSYNLLLGAVRRNGEHPISLDLSLAAVVNQLGSPEKARRIYEKVLARQPANADALIGLSGALATLGDQAGADRALDSCASALSDSDIQGQLNLAMAYDKRYLTPRGLAHAQKALAAAPGNPGVVYSTAGLMLKLHQFDVAAKMLEGSLRRSPGAAPLHRLLAQILVDPLNRNANFDMAEHHYIRALNLDPSDTKSAEGLGRLMLDRSRPKQAVYALNLLLRNEPRSAAGRMLISRAYSMIGDQRTAAAQRGLANRLVKFEREESRLVAKCRLEKTSETPRIALSGLYADNGDFRRALTYAESAALLAPTSPAARAQLTKICGEIGIETPSVDALDPISAANNRSGRNLP